MCKFCDLVICADCAQQEHRCHHDTCGSEIITHWSRDTRRTKVPSSPICNQVCLTLIQMDIEGMWITVPRSDNQTVNRTLYNTKMLVPQYRSSVHIHIVCRTCSRVKRLGVEYLRIIDVPSQDSSEAGRMLHVHREKKGRKVREESDLQSRIVRTASVRLPDRSHRYTPGRAHAAAKPPVAGSPVSRLVPNVGGSVRSPRSQRSRCPLLTSY